MELVITTLNKNENAFNTEDSKDGKIKYLEFKNKQLEEENKLLLAMLAESLGKRTVIIREEALERKPHFRIEENMGGDILISCR